MVRLLALTLLLTSCAATPKGRAIQTVVVSDAVADEVASNWSDFVDRRIAHCRTLGLETPAEREDCLGSAAHGEILAASMDSLVIVQRAIRAAVKCEKLDVCLEEVDWVALRDDTVFVLTRFQDLHEEMSK